VFIYFNVVEGTQHHRITNTIGYFICEDNKTFSTIDGKGFRSMVKEMCPNTLKVFVDSKFKIFENQLRKDLKTVSYFSLPTDIWTDTLQISVFYVLPFIF